MGWFNVLMTKVIVVSGRKDGRVDLIGFHAADSGSQSVELLGCPESNANINGNSQSRIPDSRAKYRYSKVWDSRLQEEKFPRFRNPDTFHRAN